ncbi:MAG TPA: DUF4178 domain-containing protein [Spirochaetota bacterium]|nr:DUF4178 domain-containing protein [Spirochaetota bacterium]
MGDNSEDIRGLKCTACGGDLGKSYRIEGSGEDAEEIPIAKCLSCGNEFDQHTQEYYQVYADMFIADKDLTVLQLGAKGEIDGIEYEIIGRIRYQEEEEYELSVWDEWMAVSSDGVYHWFVEEDGKIFSFTEYAPEDIDLEADGNFFTFEGGRFSKEDTGFVARIVYAEGELSWEPEIGESVQCYDFTQRGYNYTIEQSEDEVSITRGKRVPHRKVILAFRKDEYLQKYENTMRKRKIYRRKAIVYVIMMILAFSLTMVRCFSGHEIPDAVDHQNLIVLTNNVYKVEEGNGLYFSQILFPPVHLSSSPDKLYEMQVSVDKGIQDFRLEWQSYRLMLIKKEKIKAHLKNRGAEIPQETPPVTDPAEPVKSKEDAAGVAEGVPVAGNYGHGGGYFSLKNTLEEVDALQEPMESLSISGDFWDEEGYDDEGHWHEYTTSVDQDFALDETGDYYIYLESYSQNRRRPDSLKIAISDNVKSYRYFLIVFFVFLVLWIINHLKSKSYNELPFEVAAD